MEVVYAGDPGEAERLAAGPVTSVGDRRLRGDDGPRLAEGVPDPVVIGDQRGRHPRHRTRPASGLQGQGGPTRGPRCRRRPRPWSTWAGRGRGGSAATRLRRAAAAFVRAAGRSGTAVPGPAPSVDRCTVDDASRGPRRWPRGPCSAAYRFVGHKSEDEGGQVERLVGPRGRAGRRPPRRRGIDRGARIAEAVGLARGLVNEPPVRLTPSRLAEIAQEEIGDRPR